MKSAASVLRHREFGYCRTCGEGVLRLEGGDCSTCVYRRKEGRRHNDHMRAGPESWSNDASDATPEELEFMFAMDRYKREHRRPFPTWREVLAVLRSLGWKRNGG